MIQSTVSTMNRNSPKIMFSFLLLIIYTIITTTNCVSISFSPQWPPPSYPAAPPPSSNGPRPASISNLAYPTTPASDESSSAPVYESPAPSTPTSPGPSSHTYPAVPASPRIPVSPSISPSDPLAPSYPPMNEISPGSYPPEKSSPAPCPLEPEYGSQGIKAAYWPSFTGFPASSIETSYFTHIYYAFLLPEPETFKLNITPFDQQNIPEFIRALRARNPPVKTLLSVGGAGNDPTVFSKIASTQENRAIFINSSIEVARQYGFDGVDLDWEFATNDEDMFNLGLLFGQWRLALDQEATTSGQSRLLLTSAVYYSPRPTDPVPRSYPAEAINRYVDWINPMCYDYHGSWENFTGPNSALYDPSSNLSTVFGIGSWIQAGVSPQKLVMGLPLYGRTWTLQDPNVNGIGARALGAGPGDGILTYNQIIEFNNENKATVHFDGDVVSYYSYARDTWIGYDDIMSVDSKIRFARAQGLGGYFFWALGQDNDWTISRLASNAWGR